MCVLLMSLKKADQSTNVMQHHVLGYIISNDADYPIVAPTKESARSSVCSFGQAPPPSEHHLFEIRETHQNFDIKMDYVDNRMAKGKLETIFK